jgi:hypothetical protein
VFHKKRHKKYLIDPKCKEDNEEEGEEEEEEVEELVVHTNRGVIHNNYNHNVLRTETKKCNEKYYDRKGSEGTSKP